MTDKITLLVVPDDAIAHAVRFGAERDPITNQCYVIGEVPKELLNYLPKVANRPFLEPVPSCPKCGGPMRKIYRFDGNAFWGCFAYFRTGCKGAIDYVDYLQQIAPANTLTDFLPTKEGLTSVEVTTTTPFNSLKAKPPHHMAARWKAITQEALQAIGTERKAIRWLEQPKVAFANKSPIEMMATHKGCDAVEQVLRDIWR